MCNCLLETQDDQVKLRKAPFISILHANRKRAWDDM
jgi:hypothetical protein